MISREWRQTSSLTVGAIALVAVLGFDGTPQMAQAQTSPSVPQAPLPQIQNLNAAFADLSERLSPTVVNIYTKTRTGPARQFRGPQGMPQDDFEFFFENPFGGRSPGRSPEVQALGSGFVLDKEGHIVTNAHVVNMAGHQVDEVMIKFNGEEDGKGIPAKIVGVDPATDVAILKLTKKRDDLKPVALGDSDKSRVGEWVLAIGNPYGHSHSVTQGIISAKGRSLDGIRSDFLQTSASINPGNSGGPLFNMNGEVVGINTAIDARAQGIGFAIPINSAKTILSQLKDKGKVTRPWLGVAVQDLSEDLKGYMKINEPKGVLISDVVTGTPAQKAGLEPYDVITKVDSKEIKNSKELIKAIERIPVGQKAKLEILRNNKIQQVDVILAEQPTKTS